MPSDSCSLARCDFYCQITALSFNTCRFCSKETPVCTVDVWKSLLRYIDLKGSVLCVWTRTVFGGLLLSWIGMIRLALHYLLSEHTVSHPVSPQLRTLWSRSRLLEQQGGRLNGNKRTVFPRPSELKLTVCVCVCVCLRYLTHLRVASPHLFAVITLQCVTSLCLISCIQQ